MIYAICNNVCISILLHYSWGPFFAVITPILHYGIETKKKKLTSLPITQNKYFSETIDRNVNAYNNNTNNKKEYQSSQNKNQLYIVAWHFLQNTHCSKNGKKYIHTISKNQCL